tara:strand:- start:1031 stop:1834 length:804 start_codon:yes stop_codon:yes gene_type:complete
MSKRRFLISISILLALGFGAWFSYEEYWEYRVKEEAKAFGYELNDEEVKNWVKRIRTYNRLDGFDEDIENFVKQDKISPPPKDEFLFIGSSSIRLWSTLQTDMFPLKVINRGFGGAHTKHINRHIDKIVFPYEPKAIIFFCGTNDINGWNTPEDVFSEFKIFYNSVQEKLPNTLVFAISIQPSPSRFDQRPRQIKWNNAVSSLADAEKNLVFVDVSPPMLSEKNEPRPELYIEDMLHLNEKGYEIWTKLVRENLQNYFSKDFKVEIH